VAVLLWTQELLPPTWQVGTQLIDRWGGRGQGQARRSGCARQQQHSAYASTIYMPCSTVADSASSVAIGDQKQSKTTAYFGLVSRCARLFGLCVCRDVVLDFNAQGRTLAILLQSRDASRKAGL